MNIAPAWADLESSLDPALEIVVPGQPQGKGRARFARQGKFMRAYTPEKTVAYEGLIALAGERAMAGRALLDGPVAVSVHCVFQQPKSWSKKRCAAALLKPEWHTSKPDGDNVLKAVGDGLNGIVWKDDSQIASATVTKEYGETPVLMIEVLPL